MTGQVLVVSADQLNLRELPDPAATILATLPKGLEVVTLDEKLWNGSWRRVQADLGGQRYNGYVAQQYLAAPPPLIDPKHLEAQMIQGLRIFGGKTLQLILNNKRRALTATLAPILARKLASAEINTSRRLAFFFGQTALETDYFATLREYASGKDYDIDTNPQKARLLGNVEPGDGPRFKGRGMIQLTGRSNYRRASHALGLGEALLDHPERLEDPEIAVDTALWYWTANHINAVTDRTGSVEEVVLAVSRAVNTGNPDNTVTPHHLKERRLLTQSGLEAFATLLA